MADRVVSVRLQADIGGYVSDMAKAAAATKALGSSAEESNRRVKSSADEAAKSTTTLGEKAKQSNEKVKDSTEKVKLSAGDAVKQLGGVRAALTELGRNKVGVGIDTIEARTQLERIRKQLEEIDSADADPRVDAETSAAQAQLRSIQSQLNSIDGQSVRANVDVDDHGSAQRSASNINTLMSTALAVSPALGSIGAAAVAGIGAIAPLAASAAAGLSVLALGFSGVGDAVKLLDQRQEAVTTNAAKGAASQVSSAGQIASAQASLASAQASAADGSIRAAERVADARRDEVRAVRDAAEGVQSALRQQENAERQLTREQRNQRQAQLDLIDAREEASEQLEDLSASVEENALAQRQSVLDVADARREMDKVLNNPAATAAQREQARIDFEEQVLRQEELTRQGKRLAAERAEANAKGVEGSEMVATAQERVAAADEGVADAARAVGEAAIGVDRARVEGAEKIADAQRQVASAVREQASQQRQSAASIAQAQRGVQAAMEATGAAGVSALAGIDAKLAEVNPSTMRFAEFVDKELQPAWERLKETAAGGLLPGVQEGVESLLAQEPRITRFVDTFAKSLGGLAGDSLKNLSNPQWARFFDMLEDEGVPQLESMWRSGDNVAEAFASIAVAFAPLATDVAAGIEDLTERFATWSANLADSEGFHEFEAYVRENWPKIREIIANVADTVGAMVEAGAPIGAAYLTGFQMLTDVLSGLPVGVVQALLVAFLGFKAVQSVTGVINGVAGAFKSMSDAAGSVSGAFGYATDSLDRMQGRTADARRGMQETAEDAEGVGGAISSAFEGAEGGVEGFETSLNSARENGVGRLRGAASGMVGFMGGPWGAAMLAGTVLIGTWTAQTQKASAQEDKWAQALGKSGQAASDAIAEYNKARDARVGFDWMKDLDEWTGATSSMEDAKRAARELWQEMSPLEQAQSKAAEWSSILNERLEDENATTAEVEAAKRRYAYWTGEVARQQGELDGAAQGVNGTLQTQILTLDELTGEAVSATQAESAFYEAVSRADGALEGLTGTVLDNEGSLNTQSEAGRKAADVLFGVRDAGNKVIDSMIEQGATTEDVLKKDAQLRDGFIKTATQMGLSEDAALKLADQIYGIPAERRTTIIAETIAASGAVKGLQDQINGLVGKTVTVKVITDRAALATYAAQNGMQTIGGRAFGGPISGPGGPTDDAAGIFALSDGEYVVRSAAVSKYGVDFMNALNAGAIGQFATGGLVSPEIRVETDNSGLRSGIQDMTQMMANSLTKSGVAGAGAVGGAWGSLWSLVKSAIPQARINSTFRPGDPGYHGRGKAIDFGFGSGPGGAGSAGLASINRLLHDKVGSNLAELIYSGVGDDRPDLKNGRPLTYSAATNAAHKNHVHAAVYHQGTDYVPRTGFAYLEQGEAVIPANLNPRSREFSGGGGRTGGGAIDTDRIVAAIRSAGRGMNIEKIVTERNETGYELAERLAFTARVS